MSNQPGLWDAPASVSTPEPDLVPLDAYGATPDHVEVPADYIPVDYEPTAPAAVSAPAYAPVAAPAYAAAPNAAAPARPLIDIDTL